MTQPYDAGGVLPPGATLAVNTTGEAERVTLGAPWPIVDECHGHKHGLGCAQCDGTHVHVWKAWKDAPHPEGAPGVSVVGGTSGSGVPVRCVTCGGRKCDTPACRLRRHHFGEDHDLY